VDISTIFLGIISCMAVTQTVLAHYASLSRAHHSKPKTYGFDVSVAVRAGRWSTLSVIEEQRCSQSVVGDIHI
jgi:hypothetical protein